MNERKIGRKNEQEDEQNLWREKKTEFPSYDICHYSPL